MLINIQFLRFFAALVVVMYHAEAHLRSGGHESGPLFGLGTNVGFAGVDVFFVISGFIMVWTTRDAAGVASAVDFAKRRVARVYSGYWPFYLLALGLYLWLGGYLENKHLLSSLVLWPTELRHLVIPVSWTLIFEMGFYLLFTLLIVFSGRRRLYWICGLFAASLAWFLYAHFVRHAYDPGQLELMSVYEQYLLFPYLLEFLAGALLAYWYRRWPTGRSWSLVLAGVGMIVLGSWINERAFDSRLVEGYFVIWRVLLFGPAAVLLLAGLLRLESEGWKAPVQFSMVTGGASYAFYLSHTLILAGTRRLGFDAWTAQLAPWAAQAAFAGLVALILLFSVVHYLKLERPLHRLMRNCLRT